MKRCTSTRTGHLSASRVSRARCRSTSKPSPRPTWPIPAASRPPRCSRPYRSSLSKLTEPRLFIAGVTGSTGSGRKPVEGTHHPLRHGDLYSYSALAHRHAPEIAACAERVTGTKPDIHFVPHSGPFARGIHVTVQGVLKKPLSSRAAQEALAQFYRHSPFVHVTDSAPRVKDIATSNYANLSAVTDGTSIAVMSVLDNLNKGAAGGGMQWMNRLLGFDETLGLGAPAPGWT